MTQDETPFAELVAASNFSFLHGSSHGSDLVAEALRLGHAGLGIADRNTVAGVVRAWQALNNARSEAEKENLPLPALRLVTGARLVFADGTPDVVAYPEDRRGWGRLCRLLSKGNMRADKGGCVLGLDDLLAHLDGLLLIVLAESTRREGEGMARREERQTVLPDDPAEREGGGGSNVLPFRSASRSEAERRVPAEVGTQSCGSRSASAESGLPPAREHIERR